MAGSMLEERLLAKELMDDPELPEKTYHAVLADLAQVNRITLAYRPTLRFLDQSLGARKRLKLLDVGFGQGDMLREIAKWAKARGVEAELVGVDLNSRSSAAAKAATSSDMPINYCTGDYADLIGDNWDFVTSSLVAHHMNREELVLFLRFMEAEARLGWFVNDLHRHAVSYAGYPVLATLARWHPIVRSDGRTSIARSFRPAEWQSLLDEAGVSDANVQRHFPFRLCVSRIR